MNNHFQRVENLKALQELLAQSAEKPVVIFKHSTTCSVSAGAYEEMAAVGGEVALVDVQSARDISREIAMSTGVEHESPQVIILRNGKPVWHTSHWSITKETVEKALRENP
ncbi:MAG TPA: bacillithiol system redox-active protein YtxJ [Pyrinomonadaceae bacterium]|nr:bacillithiol system redox-active protein YtxJ [Pyrinomonadaceae bacterium]